MDLNLENPSPYTVGFQLEVFALFMSPYVGGDILIVCFPSVCPFIYLSIRPSVRQSGFACPDHYSEIS